MEILRPEEAATIVISQINLDSVPGPDVLASAFEATIVLPVVVEAPGPATTSSGLPKRKRLDLGESDPDFKMAVLDTHGRKSNAEVDPARADLLKAVASLDIPELEAFAAGDMSLVQADILAAADSASLTDAKKYAGNIAVVRREQEANYVQRDPETVNRGLGAIVGARIRAEKALAETAGKPEVEAPPSLPLPTRVPMQKLGLVTEGQKPLARQRAGAFRLSRHVFVDSVVCTPVEDIPQALSSVNDDDDQLTTIIPELHFGPNDTVRISVPRQSRHERNVQKNSNVLSRVIRWALGGAELPFGYRGRHSRKAIAAGVGQAAFVGAK